jgi:hypothetical protein
VGNHEFQPYGSSENAIKAVLLPYIQEKSGIDPDESLFCRG